AGKRWIVSGHHRLELLRGQTGDEEVRAVILREKDGWRTDQARVYGAALNIKEGGGDVDDYATFFRESTIDLERATAEGLVRRENARLGYAIGAQGGDNTFYGFLSGELSARKAAAIAEAAPGDQALQDTLIDRNIKLAEIPIFAEYARRLKNSGALNLGGVQLQLFTGKEHSAMLAAMQKESKAASEKVAALEKKAAALEKAIQAGKTLTPAEMRRFGFRAGNKVDMIEQAAQLHEEAHRWKHFFQHPDILAVVQKLAGTADTVERYHQKVGPDETAGNERIHDLTGKTAPVVVVDSEPWRGSVRQFRDRGKAILNPLRSLAEPLVNTDTGWEILFTSDGIRKTLYHKHSAFEWQAIEALPQLVENAVLYREKGDKKERGSVEGFAYLYAPVVVGGRLFAAELTVKNSTDGGHRFYLHKLKLKDPAGPKLQSGVATEAARPPAAGSLYSISQLLGIVNERGPEHFYQSAHLNTIEPYYQDAKTNDLGRGYMDWHTATPTHRAAAIIGLTKKANVTTVSHELSHVFLADMRDFVESGKADPATVRAWGRLLFWAGDLSKVENVEKVARGFEQYLHEGRAPSLDLVNSFDLFSRWFGRAWANVREYVGQELSDKVRGVYDSWLAVDAQISEADAYYAGRNGHMFNSLIDDEDARRALAEKRERNRKRVKARFAGDMVGAWMDAHAAEDQVRAETVKEIRATPAYQAITRARRKKLPLDGARGIVSDQVIADITAAHGDLFTDKRAAPDVDGILKRVGYFEADSLKTFLAELADAPNVAEEVKRQGSHGRRKRYYEAADRMTKAGGLDMETAIEAAGENPVSAIIERHGEAMFYNKADTLEKFAADNGFMNAEEMLIAWSKAPNIADLVEQTVAERIKAKAAEARQWATDQVDRLGDAGLHNHKDDIEAETIDDTRRAIWQSMRTQQRRRQEYIDRRIITDRARADISKLSLREACNYGKWAEAERRHAANAAREAESGDREVVMAALDKQQYFHALVTEAYRIREERQKFVRKYSFRMAQSDLSTVEYKYREVIKDILSHWGIIKSRDFVPDHADPVRLTVPADSDGGVRDASGALLPEAMDVFMEPLADLIPPWLMNKQRAKDHRGPNDLTVEQMREMDATIDLLMSRGRGELHAFRTEKMKVIADYKAAILKNLEQLPDHKKGDPRIGKGRRRRKIEGYIVNNLMIERILAEADGNPMLQGREMGVLQDMGRQIRNAETEQRVLLERYHSDTKADFDLLDAFAARLKKQFGGKLFSVDGVDVPAIMRDKLDIHT
ncbi:MAG: hypothetical protein LIP77_10210, partial [Planctomycetes bacterium]|nr:hypothetical protein [Planctomycetota bacterium]